MKKYPDDLTDKEWDVISSILEKYRKSKAGRKPILDAIFYLLRTGCSWRHLPNDFPNWKTVSSQFRRWQKQGLFKEIHDHVRKSLKKICKEAQIAIVDSQSVKTTEKGALEDTMVVKKLKAGKDTYWWITMDI